MAQQFDYPETETQLREILDKLYQHSKEVHDSGGRPAFKGLIEIMSAEATIITAIHNIKSNHGSETPGVDSKTMQKDYLQKPFSWVIKDIQSAFKHFEAQKIRRKYIDKPGKSEKRPLGIPTIRDRIVQECMRIVLEPILEAQFFYHSYGFRPMRDTAMALQRINYLTFQTGYHWIVEGDISKCFDCIDHSILLKRLYHMGIKDRRVLQIIKVMLKAGVMGECKVNEEGTPQGGLISPLLANAYLDMMDEWITGQWEQKRTRYQYAQQGKRLYSLRKTALTPGFLVRYADDFVIITDTRAHAESWKNRLQVFLQTRMKLTLSTEKTLITDVRRKYIKFLGYEFKQVPGKAQKGYVARSIPDRGRLKRKVDSIAENIKKIPRNYSREQLIAEINRINSQIRGVIQYYQCCTWVNVSMKKYSRHLQMIAKSRLKQYKGKWIPANQTQNLPRIHQQHKQKIPSVKYRDIYVGFTALTFCNWEKTFPKNKNETPYSETGRQIYFKRTKKKRINARLDEMYSVHTARIVTNGSWGKLNNFEFIMNRAYALNRDKLKCRVCGGWLISGTPLAHRVNPNLPLNKVNRVDNLVSLHKHCFDTVNNPHADISEFDVKAQKKIQGFPRIKNILIFRREVTVWCNSAMLLLLLPAKFRGKINLPDKVVVYVNPLDAVAAGLVGFVDNDLVHKFMQELGSQRCRLGVLLYNFQKTSDIDSLRFGCLYNDAQTFNGLFQFCLLRFIGCGQFGKSFVCQLTCHIVLIKSLYNCVQFRNTPPLLLQLSFGLLLFRALNSQFVFYHAPDKLIFVLPRIGHNPL